MALQLGSKPFRSLSFVSLLGISIVMLAKFTGLIALPAGSEERAHGFQHSNGRSNPNMPNAPFEFTSKRYKISPSKKKVKRREVRVCRDKHPQEKLARMVPFPADLVVDFTKRGMRAKRFEGSLRDDYF